MSSKNGRKCSLKKAPHSEKIVVFYNTDFVVLNHDKMLPKLYHGKIWRWRDFDMIITDAGAHFESSRDFVGFLENERDIFKFVTDLNERMEILDGFRSSREFRNHLLRMKGKLLFTFTEYIKQRRSICLK